MNKLFKQTSKTQNHRKWDEKKQGKTDRRKQSKLKNSKNKQWSVLESNIYLKNSYRRQLRDLNRRNRRPIGEFEIQKAILRCERGERRLGLNPRNSTGLLNWGLLRIWDNNNDIEFRGKHKTVLDMDFEIQWISTVCFRCCVCKLDHGWRTYRRYGAGKVRSGVQPIHPHGYYLLGLAITGPLLFLNT